MKSKEKIVEYAKIVAFLIVVIALFWKCQYGYATLDEAFYPTIAYRFLQGDAILSEEWSNTQMTGILLMPCLAVYKAIVGNMDGIYLAIRITYTIIKILIATFLYVRLRQFGANKAYIVSMTFLIYSAYGMMVLSYNSIAFGGMIIALILQLNPVSGVKSNIYAILSGIFLGIAVLGIPYMIIVYFVYLVMVIIINKMRKPIGKYAEHIYSWKTLGFVTLGGAFIGIISALYILSNSSIADITNAIPHILYGDPAHPTKSLYRMTIAYFVRILIGNNHNYFAFGTYMLIGLVVLLFGIDKKRSEHLPIYKAAAVTASIILIVGYCVKDAGINTFIFVPNILAIILAIVSDNRSVRDVFLCICIPGFVTTYCEYIASNTGFSGICASSCVVAIGSILIICIETEDTASQALYKKGLVLFLTLTLSCLFIYRMTYVFWEDGGIPSLTERINYGTCRGLLVTEEEKHKYDMIYSDTEAIRALPQEVLVLYQADQVLWMSGNQRCASYSPLNYSLSGNQQILYDYYEEHPDKIADIMYISKEYGELWKNLSDMYNYSVIPKEYGVILKRNSSK